MAEVFRNGQSVNLAMVQSGQAFAYRKYLSACDRGSYLAAVAQAKQARRGVWAVSGGIERPWYWRHGPSRATSSRPGPPPVLAYLARFMYPLRQWLTLLAIARPARRLATSPSPSSY